MQKKYPALRRPEQGIALFTIIIFVLLTMLMALWASRTAIFNELLVSNDANYQRAYEAAQALIQDAELDIRGEQADGKKYCVPTSDPAVCRAGINPVTDKPFTRFPSEEMEVGPLLSELGNPAIFPLGCKHGICTKQLGKQDFWNNNDSQQGPTLEQMTAQDIGARYGQYTGAAKDDLSKLSGANPQGNPILAETDAGKGGWYWIEVLPYDPGAGNSSLITNGSNNLAMNLKPNVVYRITALAYGHRNTMVVLQQTYARQVSRD